MRNRNIFSRCGKLTAITIFERIVLLSLFELCGNFLATFHGHSDHSAKLLARKFYYFVPGLKRSLRSRNDNQLSSPLSRSRPLVFRYRGVESFLKYDRSEKSDAYIENERNKVNPMTLLRSRIYICRYDIKNFTHNYREYAGMYYAYGHITRFETSACGVVHGYITFPANGSGRLE